MRHAGNIFETENYRGTGKRTVSMVTATTMVLSVITVFGAFYVMANFDDITARIAIWMAEFLSSGIPLLTVAVIIIFLMVKVKIRRHRRFRDW